MTAEREITCAEAIREATEYCLSKYPEVYVLGLGVTDPGAIFGTTRGLHEQFGERIIEMQAAENGMTGVAIGSAIAGMRPIMTHQRVEFAMLGLGQLINQAAKWHYMFDGKMSVPLVIRLIMGRGWGQGAQHSQSLHSLFAHIPGLEVVMPFTPYDAKGMLIEAVESNNPVIFLEHRWLHQLTGPVPVEAYRIPFGKSRIVHPGHDLTVVAASQMTMEGIQAARMLSAHGISAEVLDLRSIRPLDTDGILESVRKTGRLIVADHDWGMCGLGSEIIALVSENILSSLKAPPVRIHWPEHPLPTAPSLAKYFYPGYWDIVAAACRMMGVPVPDTPEEETASWNDTPNSHFTGPF